MERQAQRLKITERLEKLERPERPKSRETKETKETRVIKIKFFGNGWGDLIVSLLGSGHFRDEKI